jgi:hypothetical protein
MRKLAACVRVVVCALALGAAGAAADAAQASPQEFQARLAPHGRWLTSSRYGRVWQPTVATSGWNPYYDGHWEYTDVGQTWVSDYPWGSVAYHYGTWAVEPGSGWVWIPGDTWAPSWVVFRTGPDVIGWAPVAPGFLVGGAIVAGPEVSTFVFVPSRQFFAPRVRACALPASRTSVIVTKTTIVQKSLRVENHVVVNRGPGLEELRHATGHPVRVVSLESVKGMGPGVRREIQVDPSRTRNGVRASEAGTGAAAKNAAAPGPGAAPATSRASASTAYDTRGDAHRGEDARVRDDRGYDRGSAAVRSVRDPYDELDTPRTTRVAHQDVYARNEAPAVRPVGDAGDARGSSGASSSANAETQSDRDAKLLVSREKSSRKSAHPAGKASPSTGKSAHAKGRR